MNGKPRVLLTGASGFIGGAILEALTQHGYPVLAPLRQALNLEQITPANAAAIHDFAPDIFIHAGWMGTENTNRNRAEYVSINLESCRKLLEIAASAGCKRWIGFGSQAEYSPDIASSISETMPTVPATSYGKAKLAACQMLETLCAERNIEFLWLRLFTCYGKGMKPSYLIPSLIESLRAGKLPALTAPGAVWDYLHREDLVAGVLAAIERPTAGIYNLASGEGYSVKEIAITLAELMASSHLETLRALPETPATRRVADRTAFSRQFSWAPKVDVRRGLSDCVS